ncbi:MAG: winged helix-turn-helix transcriptional regulator [Clostridiales bacterium]|nr:winged helix-turn-helix transcriptional regulator [Clostridiales bacterium]
MSSKYKINLSDKPNFFEEAIHLVIKAAQWEGDFIKEDFHLVSNEDGFRKSVEEIDKEFEDIYNFQISILEEAIPLFKGNKFWYELTKTEDKDIFKADYLHSWSQNCGVSSIKEVDLTMFLRMNLEIFEDIYSNEGNLDGDYESLVNNHFKDSSWQDELDIKLEDIFELISNTYFSSDKKLEILKIYIDTERIYGEFQELIGACEDIVKRNYHLVEPRFNRQVKYYKENGNFDEFLEMSKITSLKEYYSDEILVRLNCVRYNGGTFRISGGELGTKLVLGILLLQLKEYSLSFEDSREKIIERCKAIGDDIRFNIISHLAKRPYYVKELAQKMELTSASISHHLSILFHADFIEPKVHDRKTYYSLKENAIRELGEGLIHLEKEIG